MTGKPGKNLDLENYEGTETKRLTCAKQNDVDSDARVQRLENLHADPLSQPQRFSLHGLGCVQHDDDFLARRTGAGVELRIEDQHAGLEGETGGFDETKETGGWREAEAEEEEEEADLAHLVGVLLHPHPGQVGLGERHGQLETLRIHDLSGEHAHHGLAVGPLRRTEQGMRQCSFCRKKIIVLWFLKIIIMTQTRATKERCGTIDLNDQGEKSKKSKKKSN